FPEIIQIPAIKGVQRSLDHFGGRARVGGNLQQRTVRSASSAASSTTPASRRALRILRGDPLNTNKHSSNNETTFKPTLHGLHGNLRGYADRPPAYYRLRV